MFGASLGSLSLKDLQPAAAQKSCGKSQCASTTSPSEPATDMGRSPETPNSAMPSVRREAGTMSAAYVNSDAKRAASAMPWAIRMSASHGPIELTVR